MYLRTHGATVTMVEDAERAEYRAELGVPEEAASCHTAIVDGYVVEGHVPAEAIAEMLAARPDTIGVALPGMPADSPGMGGDATTWARQPVLSIANDSVLTAID